MVAHAVVHAAPYGPPKHTPQHTPAVKQNNEVSKKSSAAEGLVEVLAAIGAREKP